MSKLWSRYQANPNKTIVENFEWNEFAFQFRRNWLEQRRFFTGVFQIFVRNLTRLIQTQHFTDLTFEYFIITRKHVKERILPPTTVHRRRCFQSWLVVECFHSKKCTVQSSGQISPQGHKDDTNSNLESATLCKTGYQLSLVWQSPSVLCF